MITRQSAQVPPSCRPRDDACGDGSVKAKEAGEQYVVEFA
jgi:hypothetical protein